MNYQVIVPAQTRERFSDYHRELCEKRARSGYLLRQQLGDRLPPASHVDELIGALLNTKLPCIFAESEIRGDGSDWNHVELRLLGDISIAVDVTVFDDGNHSEPTVHGTPFEATLVYVPGALLRSGGLEEPADWGEVTVNGELCAKAYNGLYARRLMPVFAYIQEHAKRLGHNAVVTIPGLGCGQFAGRFHGRLGAHLETALHGIVDHFATHMPNVRCVYFDPYSECSVAARQFGHVLFRTEPLRASHKPRSQLCPASAFIDANVEPARLYSLVAWDHVSWPGNDFYSGARSTDDGVKAAATSSMTAMTGIAGRYDPATFTYQPPPPHVNWEAVVRHYGLSLSLDG